MLNWLVIGIGDITTKRVIPAIHSEPRSRLYGVVTRDKAKGAGVAEHVWDNLADALSDPEIDAVYVATPVALHAPQTIAALKAGKHVLCEKPVAMNYAEAAGMVRCRRVRQSVRHRLLPPHVPEGAARAGTDRPGNNRKTGIG